MYPGKRRQRNIKRFRTNGEINAKCPQVIGQFKELLHGHTQHQQPSVNVLPSNPSKRHRERLNGELETVASLLPYEEPILQRLDKLSVLRLAVAFLQIKAHFQVCAQKASSSCDGCCAEHPLARLQRASVGPVPTLINPQNGMATLDYGEMQFTKLAQKALGAFLLALHLDGDIFYVTENIEAFLGFQQSDLLHQSLFEMIHSEDRDELRTLLQNAMEFVSNRWERQRRDGRCHLDEMSFSDWSFSVVLRFRCLLDQSCGFSRAEFRCRLISVHSHRVEFSPFVPPSAQRIRHQTQQRGQLTSEFGTETCAALAHSRKYALVSTCTPFSPPPQLDPQLDDPILKSRHSLDLGFQSLDLRFRCLLQMDESPPSSSFSSAASSVSDPPKLTLYAFVHPDDLKSVAEAHETAIKFNDSNLLVYRLISSNSHLISFVQSKFKLFAKNGKPDRIEANHRILTEIDGESLLEKKNSLKLKNFSFDDTLLLSPRNQQQIVAVSHHRPSFQQSDLVEAVDTETIVPMASFSLPAHSKAIFTTTKDRKGKKMGRKETHEKEGTDNERNGTDTIGTGANATSSVPSALFAPSPAADPSVARLPLSHFPSSSFMSPQSNNHLPPALPSSDSVLVNNCSLSSSLPWPPANLSSPSHTNVTPRLKRTQFTFERYYAETVDVSPYYYYCPSSNGIFPHYSSSMVDFSSGSAGVYPPAMGTDYWNSMLAMAATPIAGGAEGTDCYGGTHQQLVPRLPSPSSLFSADPSAFSLQFQQQFSPAWLNAAGSVFNFAAAASQFWPSQQICAADFNQSLATTYANGGHGETETFAEINGGTETERGRSGTMGEMTLEGGQCQNQFGETWTTTAQNNGQMQKDGRSGERCAKGSNGGADLEADATKNTGPLPLFSAQTTPGTNVSTVSNASGFRFLTEMAQTLFG